MRSRRWWSSERGQGTLEYVGVLVLVAVVVVALTPAREKVVDSTTTAWCLITGADGPSDCGSAGLGPAPGAAPPPGPTGDPDAPDRPDDPTPPDEGPVPPPDPDDPDNPECRDVLPSSGPLDTENPTKVRVGCRELWVPEQCEEEWRAYTNATSGPARGSMAEPLATCIESAYDSMEPPCTTSSKSTVQRSEMRFLFIRFGGSQGMLVEELGDGRVRIHLVEGAETGGGASGSVGAFSFDVAGLSGYSTDTTYEFADLDAAQGWVEWYGTYSKAKAKYDALMNTGCVRGCGGSLGQLRKRAKEELDEATKDEPPHHGLADADAKTRKVTLSGGLELPLKKKGDKGEAAGALSFSGDYTGEVVVEDRHWADGSQTATYSSSDAGGFLVAASLGGKGLKKTDGKTDGGGGGKGKGGGGAQFAGKTSTTVVWGPKGELSKLIVAVDDQVLDELFAAGVDVEAALPYGFGVSGGYSRSEKEGSAAVTEMVLDFEQFPELREELGPRIDALFPRDDDGDLRKDDVEIDVDAVTGDAAEVHDVVKEKSNVRRLDYDVSEVEEGGEIGVDFHGVDLFKASWTTVENVRTLSESSFEITDVEGDRRTVSPTPRCKDEPFETPDGYYTTDFSDPPAVPARDL